MVKPLDRKRRESDTNNPFLEVEKKEEVKEQTEPLKTMKVPESTHKKLLALSKTKNNKLYAMIDILADSYIERLSEQEKAIFQFMLNKE